MRTTVSRPVRHFIACLGVAALSFPALSAPAKDAPKYFRPVLIRFEGMIAPPLEQYFYRKLDEAKSAGADLLIVEINSFGGMLEPSEDIATRLRKLDWAHTVAYVPERALSGGAIVALGCDEIIMDRHARLGDAGPIVLGEGGLFRHAEEKTRTELTVFLRGLATAKGRPPALAAAMADRTVVIFEFKNVKNGEVRYMTDDELGARADRQDWTRGSQIKDVGQERFFEVNGAKAAEYGLAQGLVSSRAELAQRYGVEEKSITVLEEGAVDTAIYILRLPFIVGLLLVIGLVGLYVEFMSPGMGIGGLVAAICFTIFFWSQFLGGTGGWLAVALFLLGVSFVAIELFLFPGFAVSGITGALLILISLVMAIQGSVIPHSSAELTTLSHTLVVLFLSGVAFTFAAVFISRRMGTLPVFHRLGLPPPDQAGVGSGGLPVGADGFAPPPVQPGDRGIAQTSLRPGGKARFDNRYVDVMADGDFIVKGTPVQVLRVTGNQVWVGPVDGTG
jgi:membrane-bound serine protease (ClpP class)